MIRRLALLLLCPSLAFGWSYSGGVYTTNGTLTDVAGAVADAATNHPTATVGVPSGSYTWNCSSGEALNVTSAITLVGGYGGGTTSITFTGSTSYGCIALSAACTVSTFTIFDNSSSNATFEAGSTSGWRITGITYTQSTNGPYFAYVGGSYGVIDSNNITGNNGQAELIFVYGPSNSWQTADSLGTANAVYIENNTYNGIGYCTDINANARAVFRFNTINGPLKLDGHGYFTNDPPRSFRTLEAYNNTWTDAVSYYTSLDWRGGTGLFFGNTMPANQTIWAAWHDYATENGATAAYSWTISSISTTSGGVSTVTTSTPHQLTVGKTIPRLILSSTSSTPNFFGTVGGCSVAASVGATTTITSPTALGLSNGSLMNVNVTDYHTTPATGGYYVGTVTGTYTFTIPLSTVTEGDVGNGNFTWYITGVVTGPNTFTIDSSQVTVTGAGTSGTLEYGVNPANWPLRDQVGTGEDNTGTLTFAVATGNPATITTTGALNVPIGSPVYNVELVCSGSTPALSGYYTITATGTNTATIPVNVTVLGTGGTLTWPSYSGGGGSDPAYAFNNYQGSSLWPRQNNQGNGDNEAIYYAETGNATFYDNDVIKSNRDFFCDIYNTGSNGAFDGTSGVGVGTLYSIQSLGSFSAAMMGTLGVTIPVAYWATDVGNWNTSGSGGQGALFIWHASTQKWGTGATSATVPDYTPYGYPFYNTPAIPAQTTYATVGVSYSYTVEVTGTPSSYAYISGLPGSGNISFNTSTGVLSGTAQSADVAGSPYSVSLSATNADGTGYGTVTLGIGNPPVITSSATAGATEFSVFNYQITAINSPLYYGASGLPSWATLNTSTGDITGTPPNTSGSPFSSTVTATNNYGTGSQGVTITVQTVPTTNLTTGTATFPH